MVMFNHTLIDHKVKLVGVFKTTELLNNSYAFYMRAPPQAPPLSVNAFCIATNSAHETPVYPMTVLTGPNANPDHNPKTQPYP